MAKKCQIARNKKREKLIIKYENKRKEIKKKIKEKNLTKEQKFKLNLELNKLPKNSSPVRFMRRCQITGRARSVYRKFKLSRIILRNFALSGFIPGMTKSSW